MQIHEITIQEGLGWEIAKGIGRSARDQFIQKATGVSDPYQKTDMTGYVDPDAVKTSAAAPAKPSASAPVGFNASNVLNLPGIKQPATSAPQSPDQIRKAKQAIAVQTARDQLAGKTAAPIQPTTPPTAAPEKPGFLKTATDKIADKANTVNPGTTPVVYRFDGRALDPQNPRDASIIKQLQAQGVTSATSGIKKSK